MIPREEGVVEVLPTRGVTFGTKHGATCTLEAVDFLRRLLQHVLPKGFHKIRHYGLCSATHVTLGTLEAVREKLGAVPSVRTRSSPAPSDTPQTFVECMLALTATDVLRCPQCHEGRLMRIALELASDVASQDTS
jgi:hypothetical protein